MPSQTAAYQLTSGDLPMLLGTAVVAYVVAMLLAVVARRYLRRGLDVALYTLQSLPQWCAWRLQVEQRGPSARLVNTVRALIAAGVR